MKVFGFTKCGMIDAEINGVRVFVPDDMGNRDRQAIAEWEAAGNVIAKFVEDEGGDGLDRQLTHRQFWLAAWDIGITKGDVVKNIMSSYPEEERERIAMEVEVTTTFSRNHPLVDELCVICGLSPVELDALWEWASSI